MDNVFARHLRFAAATRAAVQGWGLEVLCTNENEHSPVLTAVVMPEGHDADELRTVILEKFNMSLGAGPRPSSRARSSASATWAISVTCRWRARSPVSRWASSSAW